MTCLSSLFSEAIHDCEVVEAILCSPSGSWKETIMDRDGSTLAGRVQAADRKYERAGSSRVKERSAFCKLGEMGRGGFCQAGWWSFGGRLFVVE